VKGRFITFEGIDGAGKSTHLPRFASLLDEHRIPVLTTREPGGTELAELIRDWFLHHPADPQTEALLAFAARSDHLAQAIRPALAAGRWVVCDRFTDSTVAYQGGGRGIGLERIEQLEQWLHPDLQPDRTYLFDLEPEEAARRRARARAADRFEAEDVAFFQRVREGYLARLSGAGGSGGDSSDGGQRILRIDAGQTPEAIWEILANDLAACCRRWATS
jgi:dTMP kinase